MIWLGQCARARTFHGLVVLLCGTGWDKLDWDRFHRGHRACHGPATRTGLQRGYMTCPRDRDRSLSSFDLSQSQWDRIWYRQRVCPTGTSTTCRLASGTSTGQAHMSIGKWDKHKLSQSACPTGTGCVCPSGTGLVKVPPFQSRHSTKFRVIPYQKTKGFLIKFGIPYQKLVSNCSKIETKNSIFFTLYICMYIYMFGMWFDWSLFHCLETQLQPRMLATSPSGTPPDASLSPPTRLPLPHLSWPRPAQVSPYVFCLPEAGSFQFVVG